MKGGGLKIKKRLSIPSGTLFIVVVAVVLSLGLQAYSQANGGVITACVNRLGFVYVVGEGFRKDECRRGDALLSWNVQGPPGPEGPKGEPGPKGDKGDDGEDGTALVRNQAVFMN